MNLDNIIEEGGLNNLEWLENVDDNFQPQFLPDAKEDLIRQWNSEFDPTFEKEYERHSDEIIAQPVDAEEAEVMTPIAAKTSNLINAGMTPKQIVNRLSSEFSRNSVVASGGEISSMLKDDAGILGCVVHDASANTDCRKSKVSKKNSKMIGFIQRKASCDNCVYMSNDEHREATVAEGMDGFFEAEDVKVSVTSTCGLFHKPLISEYNEINEDFVDQTLLSMKQSERISNAEYQRISSMDIAGHKKIQAAFFAEYDAKKASEKITYKADTSLAVNAESVLEVGVNKESSLKPVEVVAEDDTIDASIVYAEKPQSTTFAMNEIEVADTVAEVAPEVDLSPIESDTLESEVVADIALCSSAMEIESVVNFKNQEDLKVSEKIEAQSDLEIDGSKAKVEIEISSDGIEIEVDGSGFVSSEFEGCDRVAIDDSKTASVDLEINDIGSDFII